MCQSIQQRAVELVIGRERNAGSKLELMKLREPGKDFGYGFREYGMRLERGGCEAHFYLRIFHTFETKFTRSALLMALVDEIQSRIDECSGSASDEVSAEIITVS